MLGEQLDIHILKNETSPYFIPYFKIAFLLIIFKCKDIKLPGEKSCNLELDTIFLARTEKEKVDKLVFIKIKHVYQKTTL